MKKVMITLSAVACAAGLQAAVVQWGGAVDEAAAVAGSQAYLLWSDAAFSGAATTLSGTSVGSTANNGGTVVSMYTLDDTDAAMWSFQSDYSKPGQGVDGYYAVIVAPSGSTSGSYMDLGQVSGTTASSSPTDLTINTDWSDPTATITASGFSTVTVGGGGGTGGIPEPTSGLLLALGGAMLALRRKRA